MIPRTPTAIQGSCTLSYFQYRTCTTSMSTLMSTLPVSCCFKPSPATAGATLSPLRRRFLGLSFYLVSPHPTFLQHPPTLHLHAHTAVISQLICAASVLPAQSRQSMDLRKCLINLGFCHIHLPSACPGGHQGYTPHKPPPSPGVLCDGLPLLRRSSNSLDCRSGRKVIWAKRRKGSFANLLKVPLWYLSSLVFLN